MQERLFSSLNLLLDNVEGTNLLLEYLTEFSKKLYEARDFNSILSTLQKELKKIYANQKIEIILRQRDDSVIKFEFKSDGDKIVPSKEVINQNTLYNYILEKRQIILTNSYIPFCENINVETADLSANSWLGIPMIVHDKVLGAIVIWDDNPEHYLRLQDKQFLSAIADMISIALENIYLYDYLAESKDSSKNIEFILASNVSKNSTKNTLSQLLELTAKQEKINYTGLFLKRIQQNKWKLVEERYENNSLSNIGTEIIKKLVQIPAQQFEKDYIYWSKNHPSNSQTNDFPDFLNNFPINSTLLFPFKINQTFQAIWLVSFAEEIKNIEDEINQLHFIFYFITQFLEKKALLEKKNKHENYIKHLEKMKVAGELASGTVHHLNNILSVILGKTEMLKNKLGGTSSERDLELILKAAKDGASSIQRLQSNLSQNQPSMQQKPLVINELIQEVAEIIRPQYKREAQLKGIQYKLELNLGNTKPVLGDSAALREVFLNLIDNALDAMPKGGKLSIQSTQKNDKVLVFISDTGVGIPKNIQTKIFEPFYSTKGEKGNGLGLSIAANLIKQHKGRIYVDSIIDKGSIFMVELPITKKEISVEKNLENTAINTNYKVLLVDDEGIVRETFAEMLEEKGCEVTLASSAEEALQKFQKHKCDLIFTDFNMPGTNGVDLAKELKKINPNALVFVITGWNYFNNNLETNGIIDGIIRKPFNIEKIMDEIERVASQKIK